MFHASENKFDLNESGEYIYNQINKQDTQYIMVYRLSDSQDYDKIIYYYVSNNMNDSLS